MENNIDDVEESVMNTNSSNSVQRRGKKEAKEPSKITKAAGTDAKKKVNEPRDDKSQRPMKTSKGDGKPEKKVKLEPEETILEPLKILGASDLAGELMLLVQWKDDRKEIVPSKVANLKWPQLVIQFYEERVVWHD